MPPPPTPSDRGPNGRGKTELERRKLDQLRADFVGQGFAVREVPLSLRPPQIRWGKKYLAMSGEQKVRYLERLANAINEALGRIQNDRNALGALLERKERQLVQQAKALEDTQAMLQGEITRMNADRQAMLQSIAALKAQVRRLQKGR